MIYHTPVECAKLCLCHPLIKFYSCLFNVQNAKTFLSLFGVNAVIWGFYVIYCYRISLPLMESIETSPRIPRSATATHIAFSLRGEESSDSDSEAEPPPVGDSFITR